MFLRRLNIAWRREERCHIMMSVVRRQRCVGSTSRWKRLGGVLAPALTGQVGPLAGQPPGRATRPSQRRIAFESPSVGPAAPTLTERQTSRQTQWSLRARRARARCEAAAAFAAPGFRCLLCLSAVHGGAAPSAPPSPLPLVPSFAPRIVPRLASRPQAWTVPPEASSSCIRSVWTLVPRRGTSRERGSSGAFVCHGQRLMEDSATRPNPHHSRPMHTRDQACTGTSSCSSP